MFSKLVKEDSIIIMLDLNVLQLVMVLQKSLVLP